MEVYLDFGVEEFEKIEDKKLRKKILRELPWGWENCIELTEEDIETLVQLIYNDVKHFLTLKGIRHILEGRDPDGNSLLEYFNIEISNYYDFLYDKYRDKCFQEILKEFQEEGN